MILDFIDEKIIPLIFWENFERKGIRQKRGKGEYYVAKREPSWSFKNFKHDNYNYASDKVALCKSSKQREAAENWMKI